MTIVEQIFAVFEKEGSALYFGEAVTEAEHALQAAHLARSTNAANELVAAALLHDIGHLLHGLPETIADSGIDGRHEDCGADWLERHFPPAVTVPVRLHVSAKRYLCAVEEGYLEGLSPASRQSLMLQGGPFDPEEAAQFQSQPYALDAVALRRWDDAAKVPGRDVAPLESYRACLESTLTSQRTV